MSDALAILSPAFAMVVAAAFWLLVIFVIPGYLALWVARWFPQTGQWRQVWRTWRSRRRDRRR